jgi:hypothetical protein
MSTFTVFREHRIPVHSDVVGDIEIYAKVGGSGPGLLLIHGYPQCHQCVLPLVICPHSLACSLATFPIDP